MNLRFLRIDFLLPPVWRLLCIESLLIPMVEYFQLLELNLPIILANIWEGILFVCIFLHRYRVFPFPFAIL